MPDPLNRGNYTTMNQNEQPLPETHRALGPDALRCECRRCHVHAMVLVGEATPLVCPNCKAHELIPIGVIALRRTTHV